MSLLVQLFYKRASFNSIFSISTCLTRRTMKEPSFMPRANWDPSGLKATLRTASSMLQRAIKAWSARLHSLGTRTKKQNQTNAHHQAPEAGRPADHSVVTTRKEAVTSHSCPSSRHVWEPGMGLVYLWVISPIGNTQWEIWDNISKDFYIHIKREILNTTFTQNLTFLFGN